MKVITRAIFAPSAKKVFAYISIADWQSKLRFLPFYLLLSSQIVLGQTQYVLNGDFSSGATSWSGSTGCGSETNNETVYGGPNSANTVAEIDVGNCLTQNLGDLPDGQCYTISLNYQRRLANTGCITPNPVCATLSLIKTNNPGAGTVYYTTTICDTATVWSWKTFTDTYCDGTNGALTLQLLTSGNTSTCGLEVDNISSTDGGVLPIELISFEAKCLSKTVMLEWSTATETDNDYFAIEHSSNGIDFTKLGKIQGQGTSSVHHDYSYYDQNPELSVNYYRLSQTDFNGKTALLETIDVLCVGELLSWGVKSVSPDEIIISINPDDDENIFIYMADPLGRVLKSESKFFESGGHLYSIPLGGISSGIYFISVSSHTTTISQKIIINK